MGIVIKQSFWSSVWSYLGVGIGFINTLLLRPAFFTESEIGLISLVTNNALMMAPFISLGLPMTHIRYFAELREQPKLENRVLSLQFSLILLANLIFGLLVFTFHEWFASIYSENSPEYIEYIFVSLLILIFLSLFMQLNAYSRSRLNTILPTFLKDVYLRAGNIVLIMLFVWQIISFSTVVYCLILTYMSSSLLLSIYVFQKKGLRFSKGMLQIPSSWRNKLYSFGMYNLLLAGSNSVYTNIGYSMIPAILGSAANGVYTVCFYIGIITEMPKRSMLGIMTSVVAVEFQKKNYKEIGDLYTRSSLALGIIGLLFFSLILCNLNDLFLFIPNGSAYTEGFYVAVGVSLAKVLDMLFSFNSVILNYSKHYRYNLYSAVVTSAITIGLNYLLLPIMGINGATLSFFIATVVFNVFKFFVVKSLFGFTLFNANHLKLLGIAIFVTFLFWYLPLSNYPIFNIIARSASIAMSFVALAYIMKVSEDVNKLIKANLKKHLNITLP